MARSNTARKGLLVALAALAGCWSATAQQPATSGANSLAVFTPGVMPQMSHRDASLIRAPQSAVTSERTSQTSWIDSAYDFTMTPFMQDVHVPVLSVAGGRLEFGAYYRLLSAENIQMGLPGGGTLPAWSISTQSHLLVIAPRMDEGAGFSVLLRLHGTGLREVHSHGYQAINRALAFIRGS